VYDHKDQLIRENDQKSGKTWVYAYNGGGNITSKKEYAYKSGSSIGGVVLAASTAAISSLITSPVNGWFKETPNTFNSAITKGAANFVAGIHVEGITTTGRVAFKGVISSNVNTNTSVNRLVNEVIVSGSGKFISKLMKC